MKFLFKKDILKDNVYDLLKKLGYRFIEKNQKKSELVFSRLLERAGYPRFHLYLKTDKEKLVFNLHLDQKKPSYKGATAHSGEYEGEIVEEEIKRIKQSLNYE
jgi:hypothetical protein